MISSIVHMVVENLRAILKHLRWRRMRPFHDEQRHLKRRCAGHNMSPSLDRPMTMGEDTIERRCEGHDMSPRSDCPTTTGEDTLEKVWGPWHKPQFRTPQSQCDDWIWVDKCMDSQWSGYDEYEDKCRIDFHGYCLHAKDQWARRHLPWIISGWLVEH